MLPLANIFQPLIDVFKPVLVFFHDSVGLGWGWAIVALTICVRALLLPLAIKQYRSMKALQEIAPELKKVQERYKDDKQRQQQEVMKFYQENKVKRLLREAFRAEASRLPDDVDVVIVARPDALELVEREGLAGVQAAVADLVSRAGGEAA